MYHDFICADRDNTSVHITQVLCVSSKHSFSGLVLTPCYLKEFAPKIPSGTVASCVIDFPFGMSAQSTRVQGTINAIDRGANSIDLVANFNLCADKKFSAFYDDIQAVYDICKDKDVILRVVIDYKLFNLEMLARICHSIKEIGIEYIIPSNGVFLDNWDDNLAVSMDLMKKVDINVITNGNVLRKTEYQAVKDSGIFGVRLHSLAAVYQIFN